MKVKVTTTYQVLRDKMKDKVELEKKKYPLSDREQMFVDIIDELLSVLDYNTRSRTI